MLTEAWVRLLDLGETCTAPYAWVSITRLHFRLAVTPPPFFNSCNFVLSQTGQRSGWPWVNRGVAQASLIEDDIERS